MATVGWVTTHILAATLPVASATRCGHSWMGTHTNTCSHTVFSLSYKVWPKLDGWPHTYLQPQWLHSQLQSVATVGQATTHTCSHNGCILSYKVWPQLDRRPHILAATLPVVSATRCGHSLMGDHTHILAATMVAFSATRSGPQLDGWPNRHAATLAVVSAESDDRRAL